MRALRRAVVVALGAALPFAVAAQDVATRLNDRVSPEVGRAVRDIAQGAARRGLPVEPLIQKAIEGGAKGVSAERVIGAVRTLAARLDEARSALHDAGIAVPSPEAVEGGADALNAGLSALQLRELVRVSQPPYDLALTLRVAATLTALGVPANTALELVQDMIKAGRTPNELLDLPSEVQAGTARGASPSQAAQGLARGAAHAPQARPPREPPPHHTNPRKP